MRTGEDVHEASSHPRDEVIIPASHGLDHWKQHLTIGTIRVGCMTHGVLQRNRPTQGRLVEPLPSHAPLRLPLPPISGSVPAFEVHR